MTTQISLNAKNIEIEKNCSDDLWVTLRVDQMECMPLLAQLYDRFPMQVSQFSALLKNDDFNAFVGSFKHYILSIKGYIRSSGELSQSQRVEILKKLDDYQTETMKRLMNN